MSTLTREMFHAYQAQAKEDLEASRGAVSVLICAEGRYAYRFEIRIE